MATFQAEDRVLADGKHAEVKTLKALKENISKPGRGFRCSPGRANYGRMSKPEHHLLNKYTA